MTRWIGLPLLALGCVALPFAFGTAFASWGGEVTEGWDLTTPARKLVREGQRAQYLEAVDRATVRCMEGKLRVIDEVVAGRLNLEEAEAWFGRLEDDRAEVMGKRPTPPGPERQARLRRNVLCYLRAHLEDQAVVQTPVRDLATR